MIIIYKYEMLILANALSQNQILWFYDAKKFMH